MRRTRELGPGIAKRLAQAIALRELSVAEVARRAHLTAAGVYKILDGGGGNSSVGTLTDLAKALEVRPAWLVWADGEPEG